MQENNKKSALLMSITIGIVLAISYTYGWIPKNSWAILGSMVLLTCTWLFFAYQSGKRQWIITYTLIWLVGCTIEGIGITTCRPYWCFTYAELLWPKFFDTFPLILFGIWPFLVLSIAHLVPPKFTWKDFVSVWVLLLLILDLALDPVHITQWIRSYESVWYNRFGVPLQNFVWWILTWWISMYIAQKRKETITNQAWYYAWITIMVLFRIQFLLLLS